MNFHNIFFLILIYTFTFNAHAFTEQDIFYFPKTINNAANDRLYVESTLVYITPNQILLDIEGMLLPIQNLLIDENGIFVSLEEVLSLVNNEAIFEDTWGCPTCGYENYVSIRQCPLCGTKKPTKKRNNN